MSRPAGLAGNREQRREELFGDAEHLVDQARVHVDVGADRLGAALDLGEELRGQALDGLDELELRLVLGALRQLAGVALADDGARVAQGVDGVAHAVDQAGAVVGLLAQDPAQVVGHLALVRPVGDAGLEVVLHGDGLEVGAAVLGAFQAGDAAGIGRIRICAAGGEHAGGEGRVVAAAVLGMEHEHDVEHLGFLRGVAHVGAQHPQHGLGRGQAGLGRVDVHAAAGLLLARQVAQRRQAGQAAQQLHGHVDLVLGGDEVCILIVGVQQQDAAGEHVHGACRGRVHDQVGHKAVRQVAPLVEHGVESVERGLVGELASDQQEGELLVAKAPFCRSVVHQVEDVVAAQGQAALIGGLHAVLCGVAVHVADAGDTSDHTRAVRVAQTSLDVELGVVVGGDVLVRAEVLIEDGVSGIGHRHLPGYGSANTAQGARLA